MRWALLVCLLLCSSLKAEDVAVLVDATQPKSYILTIDVGGNVTLSPLKAVVRPGPSPTPQPPSPPPTELSDRGKAIRDEALKVPTSGSPSDPNRPETAQAMAKLLRDLAAIAPQAPSRVALEAGLTTGLNGLLAPPVSAPTAAAAWLPVRNLLGKQLTQLDFSQAPLAAYATLFGEVADGLAASAPQSRGISPEMWKFIEQLIVMILTMFKIPVPPLPM